MKKPKNTNQSDAGSAGAATAGDQTGATTGTTTTEAKKERTAPLLTAISTAVPMPMKNTNRGSKTSYPFAELTQVGQSFGVTNRTAKGMASIVSNQNRKVSGNIKKDANGNTVFKMSEMKDANGVVTGSVPTNEPIYLAGPQYVVADVNPAVDPDKATCRVWLKAVAETNQTAPQA